MSKYSDKNKEFVPKDYFVKFGEKMLEKTLEEDLFDMNDFPVLSNIDKEKDFTTPKHYFESFTHSKKLTKNKSRLIYFVSGIAATLVLMVSLITFGKTSNITSNHEGIATLEDLELYLDDSEMIEINDLVELHELLEEDSELMLSNIEDELLIDYLLDDTETFDLSLIY